MLTISNVTENFFVRCQVKDPIKSNEVYFSSSAYFQVVGKLPISRFFLVIEYPLFLHWYKNFKKYKYTSPDDEGEFFFNVALVCQKKCFVIDKAILKETIRLFMAGSHLLLNTKW